MAVSHGMRWWHVPLVSWLAGWPASLHLCKFGRTLSTSAAVSKGVHALCISTKALTVQPHCCQEAWREDAAQPSLPAGETDQAGHRQESDPAEAINGSTAVTVRSQGKDKSTYLVGAANFIISGERMRMIETNHKSPPLLPTC